MQQHRAECLLYLLKLLQILQEGVSCLSQRNPLLCLQPNKAHLFWLSNLLRKLGLNFLQSPNHAVLKILCVAALACKIFTIFTPDVCIMHCNLPRREYRVYDMFENVQDLMFSSSCHCCTEEASYWVKLHCMNVFPLLSTWIFAMWCEIWHHCI